jgi:hypothetical protein
MPNVLFKGRIFPSSMTVNSSDPNWTNWGTEDLGFPIFMKATIQNSTVEVTCSVERFDPAYLNTLFARANDLVHASIDMIAFATGNSLFVDIDTAVRPDGVTEHIEKRIPALGALCTAYKVPAVEPQERTEFERIRQVIIGEPALLGSMMDLGYTLTFHHVIPTNCGRVLDSLRKAVAPVTGKREDKKKEWEILREIVNVKIDYINWISAYSIEPRHGNREKEIPEDVLNEILRRTWNVMNRFIQYRKSGNSPLDPIKFPVLDHDPSFLFPTH